MMHYRCYNCDKEIAFDLIEIIHTIGYGDYVVECSPEDVGMHLIVNIDTETAATVSF